MAEQMSSRLARTCSVESRSRSVNVLSLTDWNYWMLARVQLTLQELRTWQTYINGDAQWCTELVVARVALADGCTGVVHSAGNADVLELVAQCAYERLEVTVRAQWHNENLCGGDCGRERQHTTCFVLLTSPV